MGMAHCVAKVSSLFTNCTFSHDCTSLKVTWISYWLKNPQQVYDNRNYSDLQVKNKNLFLFLEKSCIIITDRKNGGRDYEGLYQ